MKQTLIKITDDHYVVVDDSEIKEGDWVLDVYDNSIKLISSTIILPLDKDYWKKVTHSTNMLTYAMGILYISEVKELIGEVDVEKKMISPYPMDTQNDVDWCNGYQRGYNQAIEDNKDKKYTEMDMKKAFYKGVDSYMQNGDALDSIIHNFRQSLQPKTQWEVTFDEQGKLRLV